MALYWMESRMLDGYRAKAGTKIEGAMALEIAGRHPDAVVERDEKTPGPEASAESAPAAAAPKGGGK